MSGRISVFINIFGYVATITGTWIAIVGWAPEALKQYSFIGAALLASIFLAIIHLYGNLLLTPILVERHLDVAVKRSILLASQYLSKENKNSTGQRFRALPSIMETVTVVSALFISARTLKWPDRRMRQILSDDAQEWMFSTLKVGLIQGAPAEGFECSGCDKLSTCNMKYFDYLSHLYYCHGTFIGERFSSEFAPLANLLMEKFVCRDGICGWEATTGGGKIDPLATATILTLLTAFAGVDLRKIKRSINGLEKLQQQNGHLDGGWVRPKADSNRGCFSDMQVITAHRCIEAFRAWKDKGVIQDKQYNDVTQSAMRFLLSQDGREIPVDYHIAVGMSRPVVLRGLGHVAQGLIKAGASGESLDARMRVIALSQRRDGSFADRKEFIASELDTPQRTDLSAFLLRTLCFYRQIKTKQP
jgi:hypothetical protein